MRNPWLDIPLADYETHMRLPEVAQSELLASVLAKLLHEHTPPSVAVLGCAGGNGFDRISPGVTERVVGVDINPAFIDAASDRFSNRFRRLELVVADLGSDDVAIEPVALVYAALIFEYLDIGAGWRNTACLLRPGGVVVTVVQLPVPGLEAVTPSRYASMQALRHTMKVVPPQRLLESARFHGCDELESYSVESRAGKKFQVQVFRSTAASGRGSGSGSPGHEQPSRKDDVPGQGSDD